MKLRMNVLLIAIYVGLSYCGTAAGAYVRGKDKTNGECNEDGEKIATEAECKEAKKELGGVYYQKFYNSIVPKGCYMNDNKGRLAFYWNTHATGAAYNGAIPICKKIKVPPSVSATATSGKAMEVISVADLSTFDSKPFTDRDYVFTDLGKYPSTCYFIRGANDDKNSDPSSIQTTLEVSFPSTVYLDFWGGSEHVKKVSSWIGSWSQDLSKPPTQFLGYGPGLVMKRDFESGTINLMGNNGNEHGTYYAFVCPQEMCTGNFLESDINTAGNGKQRPAAGTECVKPCRWEAGRWGSSWCYTELDESQWGAECLPCTD